jgi:hypothetical protein
MKLEAAQKGVVDARSKLIKAEKKLLSTIIKTAIKEIPSGFKIIVARSYYSGDHHERGHSAGIVIIAIPEDVKIESPLVHSTGSLGDGWKEVFAAGGLEWKYGEWSPVKLEDPFPEIILREDEYDHLLDHLKRAVKRLAKQRIFGLDE